MSICGFDQGAVSSFTRGNISTGNTSVFLPDEDVNDFVKQALSSETVALEVVDKDGDKYADTFKLAGLADELKRLSLRELKP